MSYLLHDFKVYLFLLNSYKSIAFELRQQKALDSDLRAIQQIVFQLVAGGADNAKIRLYTVLKKSKETILEFYKGTAKFLWEYINGWMQ